MGHKRKREAPAIAEITFDSEARQEYLTGFHKRKLQRIKHAQEQSAKREREERIKERKELRDRRKADIKQHVTDVDNLSRTANYDSSDNEDVEDTRPCANQEDEEQKGSEELSSAAGEVAYIDAERSTTVTIQAVEFSKSGLSHTSTDSRVDVAGAHNHAVEDTRLSGTRMTSKQKLQREKSKIKRKKFRYENKEERKFARQKQSSKKKTAAEARRSLS